MDDGKLVFIILSAVGTVALILAGAWGKQVLTELRGLNDKMGTVQTNQAVFSLRLDTVEKLVASLVARMDAEKKE